VQTAGDGEFKTDIASGSYLLVLPEGAQAPFKVNVRSCETSIANVTAAGK
jgi:hypothetical protein